MSSGLTDDDRRRIESFCATPSYDRSPEDLTPDPEYGGDDEITPEPSDDSLLARTVHRLRNR